MNNKTKAILVVVMVGSLLCTSGTSLSQSMELVATGAVTPLLQYQGRLTNPATGERVADGSYSMSFSLYNVDTGGTALWSESESVTVQNGLFSTVLGDTVALVPSLFNGQALWLGVTVGGEELGPRQPVLPVAYALSLVPGAIVAGSSVPVLEVDHTGGGEALRVGGNLNVSGSLIGGNHAHAGEAITSGTVADARIAASLARDSEIWPTVLASDGSGSTLDADLLDGLQGSAFASAAHNHAGENITSGTVADARIASTLSRDSEANSLFVNVTGDTMSGDLTVTKINYSPPRTHYFRVSGEGFLPGSNVDYDNSYGMGGAYLYSGSGAMVAPVHLPQGAIVTSLQVFFYDNSASNLDMWLAYIPGTGGYNIMADVPSSGTPGYYSVTDTSISYPTIDNTLNSYLLRAWSSSWDGSYLRVMGALVTYTVSEAP